MGRTLVSITQQLAQAEERLGRYRRALARADQKIFDDLFALARRRLAAASMAADPLPMQIILLGMLIGTASAVAGLAARVEALERERGEPPRAGSRPALFGPASLGEDLAVPPESDAEARGI